MFNKIKDFFSNIINSETFGMGSIKSPSDNRNIPITAVQAPKEIPNEYETTLGTVLDQGNLPKCVASSLGRAISDLQGVELSDDDFYRQCKDQDGIPDTDGTYISVAVKVATKNGISTLADYATDDEETIEKSRTSHKIDGYAWVNEDFEEICQTIYQKKFVICGFHINQKWYIGIIMRVLKSIGSHAVILKGYIHDKGILKGRNSWGKNWIGHIAGMLDHTVKDGEFEMLWDDYNDKIFDIVAITYIPPEIKDEYTTPTYRFMTTMKFGSSGYEVKKLQEFLGIKADGSFGKNTKAAVINYQIKNGLVADGIVGAGTRKVMNTTAKSLLENWIESIKIMEGAKPSRNNPGNIRYIGQQYAVNDNGFCKFDSYAHGYDALKTLLVNACTGKSKVYHPTDTLLDFYKKYAPDSDGNNSLNYATFVAKRLGCSINTRIDELI